MDLFTSPPQSSIALGVRISRFFWNEPMRSATTPLQLPSLVLLSTPFFKSTMSLGMYAKPKNTSTTQRKPPICTDPFEITVSLSLTNLMLQCSGALFGSVVSSRLRLYRIIGFKSSNGLWEWSSRFTASTSSMEIRLRMTCDLSLRFLSL